MCGPFVVRHQAESMTGFEANYHSRLLVMHGGWLRGAGDWDAPWVEQLGQVVSSTNTCD